jgi:hypothetical protein
MDLGGSITADRAKRRARPMRATAEDRGRASGRWVMQAGDTARTKGLATPARLRRVVVLLRSGAFFFRGSRDLHLPSSVLVGRQPDESSEESPGEPSGPRGPADFFFLVEPAKTKREKD